VIVPPHAVADPETMVVVSLDACLAFSAVMGSILASFVAGYAFISIGSFLALLALF